jgi:hypothetical protein
MVDLTDFTFLAANFNKSLPPPPAMASSPAPQAVGLMASTHNPADPASEQLLDDVIV